MKRRICVLTKSYKHHGYCVAGVDVDTREFVRLVNSEDPREDEIKIAQMRLANRPINCLDIIECDFIKHIPTACQTENYLLNNNIVPRFIKSISKEQLADLICVESDKFFIYNSSNALRSNEVDNVKRSLFLYLVENFEIEATTYEYFGEIKYRNKCSFDYNSRHYNNISLTDPIYRDESQNGLVLSRVLIVASLPCVPHKDDLFYKFVAKVIEIDEEMALYLEKKATSKTQSKSLEQEFSPFVQLDFDVEASQTPGIVLFENYEALKQKIVAGVEYYSDFEYSLDNYQIALEHHNELKYVKNILEKARREIVRSYNQPLEVVEQRLDELIDMIKVPYKKVDAFIKQNQKNKKEHDIFLFAQQFGTSKELKGHLDAILNSPSFFESKWLNASCYKTTWQREVSKKLDTAVVDIKNILSINTENTASLLAHYYQTLSIESVKEFLSSLMTASTIAKDQPSSAVDFVENERNTNNNNAVFDVAEIKNTQKNTDDEIIEDTEILISVAASINPYTGEIIQGIDDQLKNRLKEISIKLKRQ